MLNRIIFTVVVLALFFLILQITEQKIVPSHASDLAIEQLQENGAREQLRIEQNAQNWLDPLCYFIVIICLFLIWRKSAIKLFKNIHNEI